MCRPSLACVRVLNGAAAGHASARCSKRTGVLIGQVTNMMTGKGRFTFSYQGEMLVGEATRVANDKRRGIASAYGPSGTFAKCEYLMSSPMMGAGTCTFSNNAIYQVHIGG